MSEPAYLALLDAYGGRLNGLLSLDDAWRDYLVCRMPEGERLAIVKAMNAKKYPKQYDEERAGKKPKPEEA